MEPPYVPTPEEVAEEAKYRHDSRILTLALFGPPVLAAIGFAFIYNDIQTGVAHGAVVWATEFLTFSLMAVTHPFRNAQTETNS